MNFTLSLTHDCNLACKYCYAGKKFKKDMTFTTAQRIVDFAMKISNEKSPVTFSFFGGESLLRFDLLKEIVEYIRDKEKAGNQPVSISVTSNGTILSEEILVFFKEQSIRLCISLDGPAHIHNINRRYKDGRGSFEDVVGNLQRALRRLGSVQVNAVYGPETINALPETFSFFRQLGVGSVHLNPNITAQWNAATCSSMLKNYSELGKLYIESYEQGQEIAVNLIDSKIILLLKGGYGDEDKCGMGETEWGFSPAGKIYPCERFIGEDNNHALCLGDINDGFNQSHVCSILRHRGNRNKKCIKCSDRQYCMNWCGCTNYFMTGHTDLVGEPLCKSEKAAIRAAKQVLVSLKNNDLFTDHFFKYLKCEN
jgi:uncharacterized protein